MNPASSAADVIVGQGEFRYRPVVDWAQLPDDWQFLDAVGVATDSVGNVLVFNRGGHPMIVFDRQGKFLRSWGDESFVRPHGLTIGPDDAIYCVDDFGHNVHKFAPDGELLLTLNPGGRRSDTGATTIDYRTIRQSAGPFNMPTNLALAPNGEMYVSDGYGNARVHRFAPDGTLISSWGAPGAGPGEFHVPHGIAVDRHGTVYVADRENSRIQLFSPEGNYLTEWTEIARPCQVFIDDTDHVFVAELGYRAGMFPGNEPPPGNPTGGRLSIYNLAGELQSRWGGGDNPTAPGDFFAPHDVWVDRFGDLYVSEVTWSAGGCNGAVPADCPPLQKFVRIKTEEAR
jgi:DNA-binding beta-propeller fold protein YncE